MPRAQAGFPPGELAAEDERDRTPEPSDAEDTPEPEDLSPGDPSTDDDDPADTNYERVVASAQRAAREEAERLKRELDHMKIQGGSSRARAQARREIQARLKALADTQKRLEEQTVRKSRGARNTQEAAAAADAIKQAQQAMEMERAHLVEALENLDASSSERDERAALESYRRTLEDRAKALRMFAGSDPQGGDEAQARQLREAQKQLEQLAQERALGDDERAMEKYKEALEESRDQLDHYKEALRMEQLEMERRGASDEALRGLPRRSDSSNRRMMQKRPASKDDIEAQLQNMRRALAELTQAADRMTADQEKLRENIRSLEEELVRQREK